jgi:hypothetical protein
MADPFTPSEEDVSLLSEHLYYELLMTFDLAIYLAAKSGRSRMHVHNAMVEAFPMHVRQLIDFFWGKRSTNPKYQRDAFAADYFEPGEWADLRPEWPDGLRDVSSKVGWGVVHLTYDRAHVTPEEKLWNQSAICDLLLPVVRCFVDNVDPAKLDPEWFRHMRSCVDRYEKIRGKRR